VRRRRRAKRAKRWRSPREPLRRFLRLPISRRNVHRELTDADLQKITTSYHHWRGEKNAGKYEDIAGFCKSATTVEITAHGYVLTPGRYVGAEEVIDDGDPFDEKMPRLAAELQAQFAESAKLEQAIKANLKRLGFGG
jgi:type I restriction enzyme M protein